MIILYIGEGNGTPLQYSCLENPMDRGAWWATVHGVTKSRTRLRDFIFTFHFYALEKEMATHSNILAWKIPWTEEPGGLQSTGRQRVGHDWVTSLSLSYICFPTPWRQGCDLSQHILGAWTVRISVPRLGITPAGMPVIPAEVGCDWSEDWRTEERDNEHQLWFQEKLQQQSLQWPY